MTKRPRVRAALALLTAAGLLAASACGGSSTEDTAASGGQTRTVTDTFTGDVTGVPVKPKRVLALWRTGSELADLGVVPVGALDGEFLPSELGPEVYAKVKNVPTVGTFEGVDIEKVIQADPDLIIGMDNGGLKIDYKELATVAPTVILKIAEPTDVWRNYPRVADLVGKSTDFSRRDAAVNRDLAAIKAAHGAELGAAKTVVVNAAEGGALWVDTSKSLNYERLTKAGFGYLEEYTRNPKRYVTELSGENIAKLGGADLVLYPAGLDGSVDPATKKIIDSPSFQRLPAVKAGNLHPLTSGIIYTFAAATKQVTDLKAIAAEYAAR
ncbi:ABC transporter substrate-binding protein [Actinomadura flavalba]|uniref:ABC transporter substrate-binding protein n=1 Tax=Actinomadura flavalba TaxID=1120938 RepID=UPI00036F46E6|nr:ABC transporter substrate-binding protein [Actinomadura flavalba]